MNAGHHGRTPQKSGYSHGLRFHHYVYPHRQYLCLYDGPLVCYSNTCKFIHFNNVQAIKSFYWLLISFRCALTGVCIFGV